jgi:hypothetical protein
MSHPRQAIREAIKAALLNHTAAGARVFETRMLPAKRLELPAITVYTLEEPVDPASGSTAPRELTRNAQIAIEAAVKQGENVDDAMDDIALEIERAMHADETFGDVCANSILASTAMDVAEVGDQPIGVVILTYSVTYRTFAPEAADVTLDNFESAGVRYPVGGAVADWLPLQLYAVGTRVVNGYSTYEAITEGTSAASGGPTGTGTDITDGTVHWSWIAEAVDEVEVPTE